MAGAPRGEGDEIERAKTGKSGVEASTVEAKSVGHATAAVERYAAPVSREGEQAENRGERRPARILSF